MWTEGSKEYERQSRKKKKKSFLQSQKKFARKGSYGRGTQLSQDMYDYFINIIRVMNSNKNDEDEMRILASNVFQEIEGKEAELCCNQIVSRAIENLLPFSTDDDFSSFIIKFSNNLRPIFCDPFGSHVLQQTIIVSLVKYKKFTSDTDEENKLGLKFFDYIIRIANFLLNNLDDFIWDMYSNSVARTVFNVLSGNPIKGEVKQLTFKNIDDDHHRHDNDKDPNVPSEFTSVLKKFVLRISSMPQFKDLCNTPINSGFLQSLLTASRNLEENLQIVDRIIALYESDPLDIKEENNTSFVRLLEVVLSVTNKSNMRRIYKLIFEENLIDLAKSKCGNFAVQKLIGHCKSKKLFGKVFAKLESEMEEVLAAGNSGVLLAVVKTCRSLEICQGGCMTMLSKMFHFKKMTEIVPLVSTLTTAEAFEYETASFKIHGCLIIEELLNFRKPINVVNSILGLTKQQLVKLLCDTKGCHITDAFVKSAYVGEKNKDKLFKKLLGHYQELATSKYGSRSLDAIWDVIGVNQKASLAEELKFYQTNLNASIYGKNFAWKIHLDNYRRDKEEWIKLYRGSQTAEKYFADILPKKKQKTS